jgi:hypothetical protein
MSNTEQSKPEGIAAWRRPFIALRGLHIPLGLHLSALMVQTYWWTEDAMRCAARRFCSTPWFSEEHAITLGVSTGLVLYFWLGFQVLHALLDRSLSPFRKAPHLVSTMIITTTLTLLIATALAWIFGEPVGRPSSGVVIY